MVWLTWCLLKSSSSSFFSRFLGTIPRTLTTFDTIVTSCSSAFSALFPKSRFFSNFFVFFHFHPVFCWNGEIPKLTSYFLLVNKHLNLVFWPRFCYSFVSQSPREFYLIFKGIFLFLHIPPVSMIRFQSFVQFQGLSPFPTSHVCFCNSFLLVCCFTYNSINCFVSITTLLTFVILLFSINSCFSIFSSCCIVLCCYWNRCSFSLQVSHS